MVKENEGRTAALEVSFAAMGVLKLLGLETRMFRRWGMTPRQMRRIGLMETAGAFLVANEGTRPVAAAGLAAMSAMMLAIELRKPRDGADPAPPGGHAAGLAYGHGRGRPSARARAGLSGGFYPPDIIATSHPCRSRNCRPGPARADPCPNGEQPNPYRRD